MAEARQQIAGSEDIPLQQGPAPDYPLIVEDLGTNTNPERWLHENHWESPAEVTIAAAGAEQNLGAAVPAGLTRRIRELTIRHAGTNNTVVTLKVAGVGGAVKVTIDVPAQTTRVWSSQDGREFAAAEQPTVQTSDITGGSTYVSASGVEV